MAALPMLAAKEKLPSGEGPSSRTSSTAKRATSASNKKRKDKDEQTEVVRSLCKTYTHTTAKLLYAFTALNDQEQQEGKATSISGAIGAGNRSMLLELVTSTLSAGMEKVVRSEDVAMRSGVVRGLRARFAPPEKKASADASTDTEGLPKDKRLKLNSSRSSLHEMQSASQTASQTASPTRSAEEASKSVPSLPALNVKLTPQTTEEEAEAEAKGKKALKPSPTVAIYERMKQWESKKEAHIRDERKKQDEKTAAEMGTTEEVKQRRQQGAWAHVQSAIRTELKADESNKLAQAEARAESEKTARTEAEEARRRQEKRAAQMAQELAESEEARLHIERQLLSTRERLAATQTKYEDVRNELSAREQREAEEREIKDILGARKFEFWPMFPNKRVLRVNDSDEFDGRVSQEFRVREESNEPGVSLLMGRSVKTQASEVQCMLFDPKVKNDLHAARWFRENGARYDSSRVRVGSEDRLRP